MWSRDDIGPDTVTCCKWCQMVLCNLMYKLFLSHADTINTVNQLYVNWNLIILLNYLVHLFIMIHVFLSIDEI